MVRQCGLGGGESVLEAHHRLFESTESVTVKVGWFVARCCSGTYKPPVTWSCSTA